MSIIITPAGINPETCSVCGEWKGASKKLTSSVHRHSACYNALVEIQLLASSEDSSLNDILELTLRTIGDRR